MPSSSSNITTAKRTRRSNKQHRHRYNLSHVLRYPTLTNVFHYTKHFLFKSAFGRLILVFMFIAILNVFFFSQVYWPKIRTWLQNSASVSDEYLPEEEF